MRTRKQMREDPPSSVCWGYFNCGRLIGIAGLKRDAVKKAERWTGKHWVEICNHVEVHKVLVKKI